MTIVKKTTAIYKLMEKFLTQKEISSYDEQILEEFGCDKKTLERYLKDIEELYDHIITIKKGHKKVWKLIRVSDIFEEFIQNSDDISQLFLMAREFDPYIFKELERGTLSKIAKQDKNIFLFKNYIMEELQDENSKKIFKEIKSAIKNSKYRDIKYFYDETIVYEDIKPIKLVFMDNNWYLAFLTNKKEFKIIRLSFIKEITKRASQSTFHKKDLDKYIKFLANIQNSMTLYGVEPKVAIIKATPDIAKYFQKNMKKFLPSQKFQKELDDGSVIFTLEYTQDLEILPLIQRWLPDLIILDPQELKEAYKQKLQQSLNNY